MTKKAVTHKDLRSIVIHMTAMLSNVSALHKASEGEKVCPECNTSIPCLTMRIIYDELKHLDPVIEGFN